MKEPNLTRSPRVRWPLISWRIQTPSRTRHPLVEPHGPFRFTHLNVVALHLSPSLSLSLFSNITVLFAAYRRWRSLPGQRSFIFDEGQPPFLPFLRLLSLSLFLSQPLPVYTSLPVCSIICSHGLMDEHELLRLFADEVRTTPRWVVFRIRRNNKWWWDRKSVVSHEICGIKKKGRKVRWNNDKQKCVKKLFTNNRTWNEVLSLLFIYYYYL